MKQNCLLLACLFCAGTLLGQSATADKAKAFGRLQFIAEYEIPHDLSYKGTTVGGLSGIDYDSAHGVYYMISDDRSAINPARFYTAKIFFSAKKIDSVSFVDVTTLLGPDGKPYPNSKQDPRHTPDPEDMRYNPLTDELTWTSEGERIVKATDTVLENPAITRMRRDGRYIDTFPLPSNLLMHATENGPRQNGVLEGLSFAKNFTKLYVNVEEPLYEDGPRAGLAPNKPWIRIYRFDVASKKAEAQYAYELDPVAYPAVPEDAFKINGIPDILSVGENKLLVLERSFSTGRQPCTIKIFLADLEGADDISRNQSLIKNPPPKPVNKKLLLNMDDLGIYVDNVEGICFGPSLPNGHKTLLLVADNNFLAAEKTQFFLFELVP